MAADGDYLGTLEQTQVVEEGAGVSLIPDCILLKVLSYCSAEDILCNVRLVCSHWFDLCRDRYLWQHQRLFGNEMRAISDAQLLELVQYAPYINHLDLQLCKNVTVQGLCKALPNLTWIKTFIPNDWRLYDEVLQVLPKHCPHLENIPRGSRFSGIRVMPSFKDGLRGFSVLVKLKRLRSLHLAHLCSLTSKEAVEIFTCCTSLESLRLASCSQLGDEAITVLCGSLVKLTELALEYPRWVTQKGFTEISKLTKLKLLKLRTLVSFNFEALAAISTGCQELECVAIEDCVNISENGIKQLVMKLRLLQELSLEYSREGITDVALQHIARHGHRLQVLNFYLTDVTYTGASFVMDFLPSLIEINLSLSLVTEEEVKALRMKHPHVNILSIWC